MGAPSRAALRLGLYRKRRRPAAVDRMLASCRRACHGCGSFSCCGVTYRMPYRLALQSRNTLIVMRLVAASLLGQSCAWAETQFDSWADAQMAAGYVVPFLVPAAGRARAPPVLTCRAVVLWHGRYPVHVV